MNNEHRKHKIFGRPRASDKEKRTVKVAVFLTQAEAELFKQKCADSAVALPEFLRRAGLGKKIETPKSMFDAKAVEELRSIGHNINRAARELSRARTEAIPVNFEKLEIILQQELEVLNGIKKEISSGN